MRVLSVASEIFPLVKTGGLADVAGALPGALAREGIAVRSLVPGYPALLSASEGFEAVYSYYNLFGGPAQVLSGTAVGLDLFVLNAPHLFMRPGGLYGDAGGRDWPDNAQRFAALAWTAAEIGRGLVPGFAPDLVHAHDWQAGLVPAYLHFAGGRRPGTVATVHNLAHQGAFPARLMSTLRIPASAFSVEGVEYYGGIAFLKAALYYADRITTVSPTYAAEIQTPEGGMGLDGLLRTRANVLSGVLNGVDEAVWNPAADPHIPARFSARHPRRRPLNKKALQARLGLEPDPEALLFGVVSRLTWQKGLDLLLAALPALVGGGAQLALLGSGEAALEHGFAAAAAAHPGRVGAMFGYDEALAHLIQAGSDALVVPSRFEPCGLTQLCALRYGSIPIVSRVGGLADTVIDIEEAATTQSAATGFKFAPVTVDGLAGALHRASILWQDQQAWRRLQHNGMSTDVSWRNQAGRYAALYRDVVTARRSQ